MEKLYTTAYIEDIEENGQTTKLFVASDETVDRQGEIISVDGWQLDNFKQNPVLLWGHDQNKPTVGRAKRIGYKTISGNKKLTFEPEFHRKDEFSRLIADLVDEGWVKTTSVGFLPKEMEDNKYTKQELLEISFVNVPANPNALGLAMAKGYSNEAIKKVMPDAVLQEKKVIPYKKYPHAPEDMDWNASAEVKGASVEDLMKMCAWYDGENPDIKGSYKLPHHTVDGYKTVLAGCQAAMGAMMGARGGVDIPEDDRQAVYNHLAKHYEEFDKEPPMMRGLDEIVGKYVENKHSDDKMDDLRKSVNTLIEEIRTEVAEKKTIAEKNTEDFKKYLEKRFENIELNVQGLGEGIKPDKGLEQRFSDIESNIKLLAQALRDYVKSSSQVDNGREPTSTSDRDIAMKVLNRSIDILNKLEKR